MNKQLAFTLAEVLITLGIIGIVAEMTIPTVVNGASKVAYTSGLKRSYAILSQVQEMIATDNGEFADAMSNVSDDDGFSNIFAQKIKVSKNCPSTDTTNACFVNSYNI